MQRKKHNKFSIYISIIINRGFIQARINKIYTLFQIFGPASLPLKRSENASEKLSAEVVCCKDLPDVSALLLKYRGKQLEPRFD